MKTTLYPVLLFLLSAALACKSAQTGAGTAPSPVPQAEVVMDEPLVEEHTLMDTLEVMDPASAPEEDAQIAEELPVYRATFERSWDLLHTRLDLSFDWAKQHVPGTAQLRLRPLFYASDMLELDAVNFDVTGISLLPAKSPLKYDYDGKKLKIRLDKKYTRQDSLTLEIQYVAKPNELEAGGSDAITSDKGLFFINPLGREGKPMQIWSQGETESNSKWFPTIDKPNERCTQEMYLTVADKYKTLSNGLLINSKKNTDGTRTDYWKMDQPHAPYLFMIAIGDFAKVTEKYQGMDVDYYVEPEYAADASSIFAHTPEMIDFFAKKLNYPYPWKKYAQVVVRDYVSGAMENTTATIMGEFVQRHKRELIDADNDKIVAHELFHQWFGDLVTTESWSNLTLNEGFANYSEYLWTEHKYGKAEADYHRLNEMNGYLASARQQGIHNLIDFRYADKENMFDAHSYNKGGLVLHMLRNFLGDEAFFAGLNLYLNQHKYQSVEVHDLRLAFEKTTGKDLNWFFNQWYLAAGHPKLDISQSYDAAGKMLSVEIRQLQDTLEQVPGIFQIPTEIDIFDAAGNKRREKIRIDKRKQTFSFAADKEPVLVVFDPEKYVLAEVNQSRTPAEYVQQFKYASSVVDRQEALDALQSDAEIDLEPLIQQGLKDPFWGIRSLAIEKMQPGNDPAQYTSQLREIARKDPHSAARFRAITKLAELKSPAQMDILRSTASSEQEAYYVSAAALHGIYELDPKEGLALAAKLESTDNSDMVTAISQMYVESGNPSYLSYMANKVQKADVYTSLAMYGYMLNLAKKASPAAALQPMLQLASIALDPGQSTWKKAGATKTLSDLKKFYQGRASDNAGENYQAAIDQLQAKVEEIKGKEADKQLQGLYRSF